MDVNVWCLILSETNLSDTQNISCICKTWNKATQLRQFWARKFAQRMERTNVSKILWKQIDLWGVPNVTLKEKFEWMFCSTNRAKRVNSRDEEPDDEFFLDQERVEFASFSCLFNNATLVAINCWIGPSEGISYYPNTAKNTTTTISYYGLHIIRSAKIQKIK